MSKVLVLKTVRDDMQTFYAYKNFTYPTEGPVKCPDWDLEAVCGNGLHGFIWGTGEVDLVRNYGDNHNAKGTWLVIEVNSKDIVTLNGKVKFPEGNVVFCGTRASAVNFILRRKPNAACMFARKKDDKRAVVGPRGTAIVGNKGKAIAGEDGKAIAGKEGRAVAGPWGIAIAGDKGKAFVDYGGKASVGKYGVAECGNDGNAKAGYKGAAIVGDSGTAEAGDYGTAVAGIYGTAIVGIRGKAKVGEQGLIKIKYAKGKYLKGDLGFDKSLKPNVFYVARKVKGKYQFVKA